MIGRTRFQNLFDLAREVGPWQEYPVAPPFADPQVRLSRGTEPQPFFLVCAKDTMVIQSIGAAEVELRYSGVRRTRLEMGDMLYIPAGTPSRIVPLEESIHLRFTAINPGLEGVAWFCPSCDAEVWRYEFDADTHHVQQGYSDGFRQFNADPVRRTCDACQTVHPAVDYAGYGWVEVADRLGAEAASQPA
jgi:hypothetical protein